MRNGGVRENILRQAGLKKLYGNIFGNSKGVSGKHIAGINSLEDFRYYTRTLKSWFDGIISLFATVTPTALPKSATTRLKF